LSDARITQLPALPEASVASLDVLPIADISASQTKKVTVKDLTEAGIALADAGSIDLSKLDQASVTKLGTAALDDDAVTAAKLADDSGIAVDTTAPVTDNFEGRGYFNSSTSNLQVYSAGSYAQVVVPEAGIGTGAVTTAKIADNAITTAKIDAAGLATSALADDAVTTAKIADDAITADQLATNSVTADAIDAGAVGTSELASSAVTYAKIQDVSATDKVLGRSTAGSGVVEEIPCTSAGRAVIGAADAAAQRTALGLGTLATATGTWTNGSTFSGTSSGTNTGDQTIQLTGDVTGIGTGTFAATISNAAVTEAKIASDAVSSTKLAADAVTAAKLANNSTTITAGGAPTGSGDFTGQYYINTDNDVLYYWTGAAWDAVNVSIPVATGSVSGTVKVGTGLQMNASSQLDHLNVVTPGTYTKVTLDAQGHATTAGTLEAADIPVLDASKITSGTFSSAFLAENSVTATQLADYGIAQVSETAPTPEFAGQWWVNPSDRSAYIWVGTVSPTPNGYWLLVGYGSPTQLNLRFGGTYNASTNTIVTLNQYGTEAGLTVGQALAAPNTSNNGVYLAVTTAGTGTTPAPVSSLAIGDWVLSQGTGANWTKVAVVSGASGIFNDYDILCDGTYFNPDMTGVADVRDALELLWGRVQIATTVTRGIVLESTEVLVDNSTGEMTIGVVDDGTY
jgi:hypothetical protein